MNLGRKKELLKVAIFLVVFSTLNILFDNCSRFVTSSPVLDASSSNQTGGGGSTNQVGGNTCTSSTIPRRVWFLPRSGFDQSIRDVLGDQSNQATSLFAPETRTNGFVDNETGVSVDANLIGLVQQAAETIATNQAQAQLKVAAANCAGMQSGTSAFDTCVTSKIGSFISTLGKQLFRRPLTAAEITDMTGVYTAGFQNPDSGVDPALSGVQTLLSAFIQDPNFLYRTELGDPNDTTSTTPTMTQYEIASAISYALTGSTPDSTLMAAADGNQLATPAQLATQAQRLIAGAGGNMQLESFVMQWLGSDRITEYGSANGPLTPGIASEMQTETQTFIGENLFSGGGTLNSLLSSNFTYANTELANYYGLTPGSSTDTGTFYKISTGNQRNGILSQGSFLATSNGSGVPLFHRGVVIRQKLLCQTLPSFAAVGLGGFTPPVPPPLSPGETTRQEVTQLVPQGTTCYRCHQFFMPTGYGLENFDVFGRYQTTQNGGTVDASGFLSEPTSLDPSTGTILDVQNPTESSFNDFNGLVGVLMNDPNVPNCFARQIMVFVNGRSDVANNDCQVMSLQQNFQASGGNVVSGFLNYVQSTHFVQRSR
ncbi:MAG: hypothetical protein C5B49_16475 [Bdellovibrio sp.]|nr:MAG: hypothetical protein C5B49_16475 [Bdellovibrio sp.]